MINVVRSTGNVTALRRVVDIAKKIDVLEPDASPLLTLTKKMSKKVAINPKFNWLEEESLNKTDQVDFSTNYTSGATTVRVDNVSRFRAGDVVKDVTTGEQLLVTALSGTDSLTVLRGWGTTSATTISDNEVLVVIGNANEEHATKRVAKIADQSEKTNYTQIFRTPFGLSRTAANSEMYGGGDLAHQRMTQLIEHEKEIERTLWFGEPKEYTSGTHYRRATGGVDYFISTNASDASGTLTETEFETFLRTGFRYGSKTKWLFAAPLIIQAINSWAKDNIQILPKEKTFGIDLAQWLTPFGLVNLVLSNLFTETTVYSGYAYLIDPEQLMYRFLANSDTKLKTNIQDNSADGEEDEYITEAGLQFMQEKKASQLYNVTSYS
jgi:hypothetical protein